MIGVVRCVRPVDFDQETGWTVVGPWQAPDDFRLSEATIIQPGDDLATSWIIQTGPGFTFEAEVTTRCMACQEDLQVEYETALCDRSDCRRYSFTG